MSWCLLQSMQHACTFAPCTTTRSFNSCSACACSCTTTAYTFLHACACMSARLCTTSRQLLTQRVWQQLALHAALDAANKRSEKQVRKWHARRRCSGLWQPLVPAHAHGSAGPESSRGTPWGGCGVDTKGACCAFKRLCSLRCCLLSASRRGGAGAGRDPARRSAATSCAAHWLSTPPKAACLTPRWRGSGSPPRTARGQRPTRRGPCPRGAAG